MEKQKTQMESAFDWWAFGYGFVTAIGLVLLLVRLKRRSRGRAAPSRPSAPIIIPERLHPQIRLMRAEGREIDAIKLIRKATGCDAKAAWGMLKGLR